MYYSVLHISSYVLFEEVFPGLLARNLHPRNSPVARKTAGPLLPATTLTHNEASCRDLAVLYVTACRAVMSGSEPLQRGVVA